MKIIFAGTPEFAARALDAIHAAGFEVVLVLTQPDRPAGRGMQLQASPVKQFALAHDMPVAQPTSLRLDGRYADKARAAQAQLQATPHDVMVVAAYGLILPAWVLEMTPHGCLNIHASLLPRWRGAAPIHRAIEAGDSETGIAIMQMDEGLDTGPTLQMQGLAIKPDDTSASLHDKLAELGAKMIVETLQALPQGTLTAVPQPQAGVTYAAKISREEARLDFREPAEVLLRKIRAFDPFPGAFAVLDGVTIKIWDAELAPAAVSAQPGQIVAAEAEVGVWVACGSGALRLTTLQKPGGKRLNSTNFLQGFPLAGKQFDPIA